MDTAKLRVMNLAKSPKKMIDPAYEQLSQVFPLEAIKDRNHHALALKVLAKVTYYVKTEKVKDAGTAYYVSTLTDLIDQYERRSGAISSSRGARMVASLLDQGLKREDVASELGENHSISRILRGEAELNTGQLHGLARRFKVTPNGQIK